MKKLFMMVALAFTTLSMNAQEDSKFNAYVGVGASTVVGDDTKGDKYAFSYKIGLTYDLSLSERFSIIPGLELVNKSFNEDGIDGTINMYYAQIPVLASFKINVSDDNQLAIKAGPYAAFGLFGSDLTYYGGKSVNVFDKNMFDRFEAGIKAGISYEFSSYSIGAEYSRSFTKMASDTDAYHQAFGAVFGYKF